MKGVYKVSGKSLEEKKTTSHPVETFLFLSIRIIKIQLIGKTVRTFSEQTDKCPPNVLDVSVNAGL